MSTILLIDDDATYRESLAEVLALESYKTLEAENGLMALEMLQQYSPNLILCDVDMPVMNGIEVLRTVKADPVFAKVPFLMITGSSDELVRKTSHDLGAEAYLTKPIDLTELLSNIVHFLTAKSPSLSKR